MPVEIKMPQQSDTMTEGTVVKWRKREGEKVKSGETVAEIETDKAVMEMEATNAGTVAAVLVPEGRKVPVGETLAVLAVGGENPAEVKKQFATRGGAGASAAPATKAAAAPAAKAPQAQPAAAGVGVGAGPRPVRVPPAAAAGVQSGSSHTLDGASHGEVHEPATAGHGATRGPATAVPPVPHGGNGNGRRVFASPLAKRIAADKGIDLSQLQGTGPQGRIVQRDVLAYAERPPAARGRPGVPATASAPLPQRIPRGETEAVPLNKMRLAIATALQRSKQQVPHFYVTVDVDVEAVMALRAGMNKALEPEGIKLSLNDFVSKAAATALLRHPALNAHFTGESIVRFGDVHLGIAVAIPDGLIVPVLRSADQMGLRELQQRTAELAKKARATPPRLKEDEMKGATFTISNLGMFGVRDFAAIINPPSVAILAVAGAEKRPVVRGDQIVARTMMGLTLSVDHRAVDGATAAEFLRTLKVILEEPGMMLV
jgi:pyruvate dehydrogenase E2 component (dihydrolipoamide acetyltransferase)